MPTLFAMTALPRRRARVWLAAAACLLAACGPSAPAPPPGLMVARVAPAATPSAAVEVVVSDVPPGRRIDDVVLLDPDGGRHGAEALVPVTRESGDGASGPSIGIGVTGGSSSGVKPSLSLGWNMLGGDETARRSRHVTAGVPLPDPAAFRAEAARWRIEVRFTEVTGEARSLAFPAQP